MGTTNQGAEKCGSRKKSKSHGGQRYAVRRWHQLSKKRDKCAVKQAYDYQYNRQLTIYDWDIRYGELTDIERAEIQIKIGQLMEFQKENGFGSWYHEDDVESRIRFKNE